ncbi:SDR family oxidoreductase [Shinella yambaruensis]|uniref:3-ketoacyl-ACP reductase n=1 Tax=Shinella yambaruensis TaxID=415996 RepID=A0ABQ5ZN78_9HYPH|nr:SDR family oxidoreductase [Shinella yambaruensis]MCJ8025157.1 SDR family oxidoreductase [Shinella yambaruensis]MCU7980638.1 SDR family oxidoreductase [Shinella yambaruensis]GLR54113.1 3-ketoacyl-ACP reductase [Shinella yambaruensis]
MTELSGKTVLITGALGTLGRAQAARLARAGASLLLLDRPAAEGGTTFAADIAATHDVKAAYVGEDLNDLAAAERRAASLSREHGGIDILINNAALIINKPFEDFSLEEYEDQVRVNSSAAFALARAVAPAMKEKRYGKIVNFCSVTLNGRWDGYVPYVASKGAMLGLTKSLARELGPHGVRVNAVSPGAVVSEAEARVFADRLQQYNDWILENQSLKARIQPADVADLVHFLVSPASDMISGQNIAIDGGW